MDFKTKRKIVIMRKFNHTDLAMIAGAAALLGSIVFMITTQGMSY
tara:strand:- start:70 stop:204 length:135 start_codon:yes stop_codon:yes gene_type:complete